MPMDGVAPSALVGLVVAGRSARRLVCCCCDGDVIYFCG